MKVRVKEGADGNRWEVESNKGLGSLWAWEYEQFFYGQDAKQKAVEYAHRLANPEIIEVSSK